jgi:branched-chain amino acid transport system substrate-binding protein
MSRTLSIQSIMLILLASIALGGCRQEQDTPGTDAYTFGVAAPFTGQEGAPVYGENIKRSVELAVNQINAAGGVRGRNLQPVYEDTQLQAPTAVSAVQKLINVHHVEVIIGPVASSSSIACADIAQEASVLLISPASTSHELTGISPWFFRTIAPDTFEGTAMAQHAASAG